MLLKTVKITLPLKEGLPHKESKERRYPIVKSNLKSIKDYGKAFDIGRLLFTRI